MRGMILVALLAVGTQASAGVILVSPGLDDRIAFITDVNIVGTARDGLYNLRFHDRSPYGRLLTATAPRSPITWTSPADAAVVMNAIKAEVNSFGPVGNSFRTENVLIPLKETSVSTVRVYSGRNDPGTNYGAWFTGTPLDQIQARNQLIAFTDAWVTATLAVPEVSTASILALGLVGLALRQSG